MNVIGRHYLSTSISGIPEFLNDLNLPAICVDRKMTRIAISFGDPAGRIPATQRDTIHAT